LFLEHRQSLAAGKTSEQALSDFKLPVRFKDYNLQGGRGGPGGNFNIEFALKFANFEGLQCRRSKSIVFVLFHRSDAFRTDSGQTGSWEL